MSVLDDIDVILDYAYFWNWAPDWNVVKDIYSRIPESYSVLTPFAYAIDVNNVQAAVKAAAEALGDTGRILVRESGTEPVIRVMVE